MNPKDFVINVGREGTFERIGDSETSSNDIDEIFNRISNIEGKKKINIYFHGGLVNEQEGLETAQRLYKDLSTNNSVFLFFVWKTGLMETIKSVFARKMDFLDKLSNIVKGLVSLKVKNHNPVMSKGGINIKGVGEYDVIEIDENYTDKDGINKDKITLEITQDIQRLSLEEQEIVVDINNLSTKEKEIIENVRKGDNEKSLIAISSTYLIKIILNVLMRFHKKTNHGFYTTIVEEILKLLYIDVIGKSIWDEMKTKAEEMWKDSQDKVGRYILNKLNELKNKNHELEINLIGHSAGSIAICRLIEQEKKLKFNNIIFLAPACRLDIFKSIMVEKQDVYEHLRIFTMNDEKEKKDELVNKIYTYSLLYFISGVLEGEDDAKILGLQRSIKTDHIIANKKIKIVYSPTGNNGMDGERTNATKHGDFDNDKSTIESIQKMLN